jgi:hypothetical protein
MATVYVPASGLVFSTLDGKAIARLSRDEHGGVLELYDDRQEPTARFSSGALANGHTRRAAQKNPFLIDDEDPWVTPERPRSTASDPGF